MKGLAVIDGDLVLSGSSYLTLTGPARIKQDLDFALHDEYGADIFHPYWGSVLDRFIGQPLTASVEQQVINEVQRVLNNYISIQTDQINSAISAGTASVYDTADVVSQVEAIDVQVNMDSISITVTLRTMANQSVTVTRTVTV